MKPKILTIVSRMNLGGIAVVVTETINGTSDKYEHLLVTGRCAKNEIEYLNNHKLDSNVIYLQNLQRKIGLFSELFAIIEIIRIIKKYKPNIIHTHASKAGFSGRIAALISNSNAKRIHTFHGHILFGYFPKVISNILIFIERFLARNTHTLIAVSQTSKNELLTLKIGKPNQWQVIPLGVNGNLNSLAKKTFELQNQINLVWVGRFEEVKNPILAIDAVNEFSKLNPKIKIKFRMVGDGNLLTECKSYAAKSNLEIVFTGWLEIPFELSDDLLLMTSKNEGFGLVILEAGLRGIPTVSTAIPVAKEIIDNGISGFISEANPKAIAEKISEIVASPSHYLEVTQNISRIVVNKFGLQKMLNDYYKLFDTFLN